MQRQFSDGLVLARPIENIDDGDEARAIALIQHLEPALREWRAAEELRQRIADNEASSSSLRTEVERLGQQVSIARAELDSHNAEGKKITAFASTVVILTVFLLVFTNFLIAIGVGAIGGFFAYKKFADQKAKKEQLEESSLSVERQLASADTNLKNLISETASLVGELGARSKGFPEVRLAEIHFPFAATRIGDSTLIVDLSGVHEQVTLHTVDVTQLESGVRHIADRTDQLLNVPPMLSLSEAMSAGGDDDGGDDALHGEEEELQALVSDFTVNLGKLKDSKLTLPLVRPDSPLAARFMNVSSSAGSPVTSISINSQATTVDQIQTFVSEANQTRERASGVFSELTEVYQKLERACASYAFARTRSMNAVHENLLQVLSRANWCSRRFYCPRSILSPVYIRELIGIDLDNAFKLSLDDLLDRLSKDSVIQQRLDSNPVLRIELQDAYEAVQEFIRNAESAGFVGDAHLDDASLPRHISSQLRESKRHLRNSLQKAMTGSVYPILNFSSEAQLFYDPVTEIWSSPTTPHSYSTPDVMNFGSMVKAYTDVMMPLWDHLWTEKADFRKSEVFRTNESMIRMTEKESEKLIEIANQFRADMRTVRENVFTLESDLSSKRQEILSFRDGMSELGLLSAATLENLSEDKIEETLAVEVDSASADRLETVLSAIPQSQAELRGAVHDPIDMIKDPSVLIVSHPTLGNRLVTETGYVNG